MDIPLLLPADLRNAGVLTQLDTEFLPYSETAFEALIARYAAQVRANPGAQRYLLRDMSDMAQARAALLAVRETSKKPALVCFACDGEGRTAAGTDVLAALIVMEGMGAAAFGVSCADGADAAVSVLERLAPYAAMPLFYERDGGFVPYAYAAVPHDPDVIPCASEKEARFITPDVDVGEPIECSPDLLEDILEAEDAPVGAVKIAVLTQDDLDVLAENQYAVTDALCLSSDVPELLEAALRVYQGRAFYDGTGDLEPEELRDLTDKYGLVVL